MTQKDADGVKSHYRVDVFFKYETQATKPPLQWKFSEFTANMPSCLTCHYSCVMVVPLTKPRLGLRFFMQHFRQPVPDGGGMRDGTWFTT